MSSEVPIDESSDLPRIAETSDIPRQDYEDSNDELPHIDFRRLLPVGLGGKFLFV